MNKDHYEARKVPFTEEVMKGLVGKTLQQRGTTSLVTSYRSDDNSVFLCSKWRTPEDLVFEDWTVNGKVCYNIEKKVNGKWIPVES